MEAKVKRSLSALARLGADWDIEVTQRDDLGISADAQQIQMTLLHMIVAELKTLNALLHCRNFTNLPHDISRIEKRLAKKVPLRPNKKQS